MQKVIYRDFIKLGHVNGNKPTHTACGKLWWSSDKKGFLRSLSIKEAIEKLEDDTVCEVCKKEALVARLKGVKI
jgi:hypothetical protein